MLIANLKHDQVELTKEARKKKFKAGQRRLRPDKFNDIEPLGPFSTDLFQRLMNIKEAYIDGTLDH